MQQYNILLTKKERFLATPDARLLEEMGYTTRIAITGDEFVRDFNNFTPNLVILAMLFTPGELFPNKEVHRMGIALYHWIRNVKLDLPIILYTTLDNTEELDGIVDPYFKMLAGSQCRRTHLLNAVQEFLPLRKDKVS